ncbi:hypothetical protein [Paenibacillus polymyxa]|uniref:hypothetical protein n=1 Tax=Paenibacillus polymyxa TaxID=1406 RepID=UPI0006BFFA52|nr:hypothetical protein [Paenibacillus polymyxa]KOS03296.1 hypothetical protein AM598_07535 [Paenibacillus polymyxa]
MKKHCRRFKEVCVAFEEISGYSFQEERVCMIPSAEDRCYYDAKYIDETNHKALVRIFLQQNGELRWSTGWDCAAEELYELYESWLMPERGKVEDITFVQAS